MKTCIRVNRSTNKHKQVNHYWLLLQVGIQPLRRMEGWDDPHPRVHHRGIQLHHFLTGELLSDLYNFRRRLLLSGDASHWILFLFQILALFHISLGQQLNLYWVHKVLWNSILNWCHVSSHTFKNKFSSPQIGVLATLLTTISGVVSVDDIWGNEWDILLVSLQVGLKSESLCRELTVGFAFDLGLLLRNLTNTKYNLWY